MINRIFLIVLDSFGIGNAEDAGRYGDAGANTLQSLSASPYFNVPFLKKMGLFNIDGVACGEKESSPTAAICRLSELSRGKDTIVGHWEISGIVTRRPFPVYPDGFPKEIIRPFCERTGHGVICNRPYSGTEVIRDFGERHLHTHDLIVYTSADSVFQIAAHESCIPVEELYQYCRIARSILTYPHNVGRVVARPFAGSPGNFYRTAGRHDFSLEPPASTLLDYMEQAGYDVIGIGKIHDIFTGKGLTEYTFTSGNQDGMEKTMAWSDQSFHGLCFVNLVDFDSLYGHRNDTDGYARALSEFDLWLADFCSKMRSDDILMITADHGCDPGFKQSTDHSREQVPLLVYGSNVRPVNLGSRKGFCSIAASIADIFRLDVPLCGTSFWSLLRKESV